VSDLAQTLGRTFDDVLSARAWRTGDITMHRIAAPGLTRFAEPIARIASGLRLGGYRDGVNGRLGHALAAAAPIDTALMLAAAAPGERCLSTAVALSGHAATVAFEVV
jgi:hypothetical protein